MLTGTTEQKIYFTLRIAVAMCFIGHGAFGIITKAVWCNYFAVFGIGQSTAYHLMPVIGTWDILLGLTMLIYPVTAIPVFLVVWGVFTALLRPLSGEPFAEFIERAGNYGAPLILLLVSGGLSRGALFNRLQPVNLSDRDFQLLINLLKGAAFLLLLGHGWLNLIEKKGLIDEYTRLGFSNPGNVARVTGIAEIAAAVTVFVRPLRSVIIIILVWKIISELFYPHYEIFEWIERGGSYGTLLALLFAVNDVDYNSGKNSVPQEKYKELMNSQQV